METKDIKAYLFSIGESTTELSKWAMERLGFKVVVLYDPKTTLSQKYEQFLKLAHEDNTEWVIRLDADVIVNKHFLNEVKMITHFGGGKQAEEKKDKVLWWQFPTYCMLKQKMNHGSPMLMHKDIIAYGYKEHKKYFFRDESRPETAFWRETQINLHTETRKLAEGVYVGIHGYQQYPQDIARVLLQKHHRRQGHIYDDEELIKRISEFTYANATEYRGQDEALPILQDGNNEGQNTEGQE